MTAVGLPAVAPVARRRALGLAVRPVRTTARLRPRRTGRRSGRHRVTGELDHAAAPSTASSTTVADEPKLAEHEVVQGLVVLPPGPQRVVGPPPAIFSASSHSPARKSASARLPRTNRPNPPSCPCARTRDGLSRHLDRLRDVTEVQQDRAEVHMCALSSIGYRETASPRGGLDAGPVGTAVRHRRRTRDQRRRAEPGASKSRQARSPRPRSDRLLLVARDHVVAGRVRQYVACSWLGSPPATSSTARAIHSAATAPSPWRQNARGRSP